MKLSAVWALFLLSALPAALGQTELFNFATFDPAPSLGVQGSAGFANGRARLTPGGSNQSGGVWFPTKRFLQEGFDTSFQFQVGSGGEGVAFVVQNNALPALGRGGSGLGYEGVPNSLSIEFDRQSSGDITDIAGSHVSVQSRGPLPNSAASTASLASEAAPMLAGGNVHAARIRYVPGTLEVFLDDLNTPLVTASVTLSNLFTLENGQAWFGIVAATGAAGATHELVSWSFQLPNTPLSIALTSPLEGGSFLTPAVISVEAIVDGPDAITQVEFFQGTQRLFITNNTPYRFQWDSMLPGAFTLSAVATDVAGRRIPSQPVRVVVYPAEPVIGVNFTTAPNGSNFVLAVQDRAGVIPQHYWNNAPLFTNGNGALPNLRDASGTITPVDVTYDFVVRGEEPVIQPDLSADHRLMRAYGANVTSQSNAIVTFSSIPFPIYDVIVYTDGANGGADRVAQVRASAANNVFVRDAAWTSFAGIYARGGGNSDAGSNTLAGNYVRLNALTTPSFTITNNARSSSDGVPLAAINAVQIVPSIYDRNSPVTITRGPYLQMATPYSMTVRWRSNRPVPGRVQYGTNANNLTSTILGTNETQEHTLVLTNLEPNTRYFYAVGTTGTNFVRGPNIFFWTSPLTNKPTRVWVLGDSGTAGNGPPDRQLSVRDAFSTVNAGRYVDLWLMLGDNAYNSGTDSEYQRAVFDIYTNTLAQSPLWPTIGNHETGQSHTPVPTTPYLSIFNLPEHGEAGGIPSGTERYYSFEYGNIHFVCLDSMTNDRSSNGPMANWLRTDLEANTNDWILVFFHHPPYTKGSHDSDDPTEGADFELVEMRENINPILESYGVDLVMSGHSHCYERSYLVQGHYGYSGSLEPEMILNSTSGDPNHDTNPGTYTKVADGTVYMVDGSSGQATFTSEGWPHPVMHRSLLNLGSVILDIDGNRLVGRFVRETGEVQDSFTIVKEAPPPAVGTPRITSIQADGGLLTLVWTARPGARYAIQRASGLGSALWENISEALTASATTHSWSGPHDPQTTAAFYRIIAIQ